MQNVQVEYSRGYRGLVAPVAIATADGASAVHPAVESLIEATAEAIEYKEDKHRDGVIQKTDRIEKDGVGWEDDSDYRLFRRIDRLPAQIGSHRAVYDEYQYWRHHIGKAHGHGYESRSMDRAKHRRRFI